MRERLRHWSVVSVLVLAVGGTLVACGDKDDSKAGGTGGTSGATLTKSTFVDELTQAQKKAGSSHVTMRFDVAGQKVKADGDLKVGDTASDTAMALTMNTGQAGMGSIEMRLVDSVFYLNFGPMTQNKFAKIDLKDKNNPIGKQYGDLVENLDPAKQVEQFKGAVTSFEQKGKTLELDGVTAKPYVITLDPSKIKAAADAKAATPKKLTYTMYVGPDNLPRRLISDVPGIAGSGSSTLTMDYSKWGEDVTIETPKKSEITEKDFLSQLGAPSSS
jgi:hypothetical protein